MTSIVQGDETEIHSRKNRNIRWHQVGTCLRRAARNTADLLNCAELACVFGTEIGHLEHFGGSILMETGLR